MTKTYLRDLCVLAFSLLCLMALFAIGFGSVAAVGTLLMRLAEVNNAGHQISPEWFFHAFILYTALAGAAVGLLTAVADWRGYCIAILGYRRARAFI